MKKVISSFIFLAITFIGFAQTTTPRVGTGKNNDLTYRTLDFKQVKVATDAAGLDTISIRPSAFHTLVNVAAVADSFAVSVPSVASAFAGDELVIHINNASGSKAIRWVASNIVTATTTAGSQNGTIYLGSAKRAVVVLQFDGAKWVEVSRMVQ